MQFAVRRTVSIVRHTFGGALYAIELPGYINMFGLSLQLAVLKRTLRDPRHAMQSCTKATLDWRRPDKLRLARSCSMCTLHDCQKAVTLLLERLSVAGMGRNATGCAAHHPVAVKGLRHWEAPDLKQPWPIPQQCSL